MSGGKFDYINDRACQGIFQWMTPDYGEYGFSKAKNAREMNPLKDKQLSELCWDMFCLLHSLDWYESGDTCEETYAEDVKRFKDKWLNKDADVIKREEIDKSVEELRDQLYKELMV